MRTALDASVLKILGDIAEKPLELPIAGDIIGSDPLIGRSTHDESQVSAAAAEMVDYFCVGPCWPTPTKPGRSAPGLDLVRFASGLSNTDSPTPKPWFAIGGIDAQRMPEVLAAGARRVVVVRAITAADDPTAAARELKSALTASG